MNNELLDFLIENPIIAAVRDEKSFQKAMESVVGAVFMLNGAIGELEAQCERLRESGKRVFLHVDLISGLRPDAHGIKYIAKNMRPDGIITTKGNCIKAAHDEGLFAIERIFVIDSSALKTGAQNIAACHPDLVEVLPGICAKIIRLACDEIDLPVIAGGFIGTKEDAVRALSAGAVAVSTSAAELWNDY